MQCTCPSNNPVHCETDLLVQEAVLHAAPLVAGPGGVALHVNPLKVVAEGEEEGQVVAGHHVGGDGL